MAPGLRTMRVLDEGLIRSRPDPDAPRRLGGGRGGADRAVDEDTRDRPLLGSDVDAGRAGPEAAEIGDGEPEALALVLHAPVEGLDAAGAVRAAADDGHVAGIADEDADIAERGDPHDLELVEIDRLPARRDLEPEWLARAAEPPAEPDGRVGAKDLRRQREATCDHALPAGRQEVDGQGARGQDGRDRLVPVVGDVVAVGVRAHRDLALTGLADARAVGVHQRRRERHVDPGLEVGPDKGEGGGHDAGREPWRAGCRGGRFGGKHGALDERRPRRDR